MTERDKAAVPIEWDEALRSTFGKVVEAAIAQGLFELPAGVTLDQFVRVTTFAPMGTEGFSIDLAQEMECVSHRGLVTLHPDGSHSLEVK